MSTGLECEFIQTKPDEWFYLLENWTSPKGGWDWRDDCNLYGPFPTFDVANEHLRDNHANPGGYNVSELEPGAEPDLPEQWPRLLEDKERREKVEREARAYRPYRYW